ncbi:hypothetical protein CY34DRAFT_18704 [Suillus luteus UH-Slu-Lm8-n1]|uniref:DUF4100 domain-containing protein n=1 Tax=Suillus luteus UH-Slu-Lm8-n1 TaxID=930992 RepID=A0A0C9Z645_9AGAM|nr:hypothetical protein CY34DRAFT_18704 [Suillus luteus UH-Slu-Lm8-n1]
MLGLPEERKFLHSLLGKRWLEQAKKLTSEEYASYFWEGIYKKLRIKIETRLMAKDPDRDLSEAFPVDRVIAIAEKLLHRDRFDADLLLSEVETESESDSSTEENSDVNTDSESSESEAEFFRKKKKANEPKVKKEVKKSLKTAKGNVKEAKVKTSKDKKPGITSPEPMDEMEGLIKRMNSISLDDPDYALYYYRATRIDPTIKELIAAPIMKKGNNNQAEYKPNNVQNGQTNVRQNDNRNPIPHPMSSQHKLAASSLMHSPANASQSDAFPRIARGARDFLALRKAYARAFPALPSPYHPGASIHCPASLSDNSINRYEESEEDETDTEDEAYAFPVERVTRNSTQGRQERFKEVFPPGQSKNLRKSNDKDKGKEKVPTIPAKKAETQVKPKSTQPTPVTKAKPVNKREVGRSQEKSWDSDDIVMDDVDDRKATEKQMKNNDSPFKPTLNPDQKILETVLRTPIRLEVGELLGTSKELSGILANAIKPKTLPNDSKVEAHSVWTKTRGLLIKIAMHCNGQAINAIIDTGSQLNIVNKHIWKTIINRPIDVAKSVSMNDANGGEGKLRGLVQNVPLDCGRDDLGSGATTYPLMKEKMVHGYYLKILLI